jgi:hypothetical protein
MSTSYHILNEPLPIVEDYNALKEEGLAFIQKVSSESWTNLNSTDPGVTILEQVCFALTELGYCSHFPIQDILTDKEEHIDFKNQFFHPDKILTVSPITINDYIKFIVDRVKEVRRLKLDVPKNWFPQSGNVISTYIPPGNVHTISDEEDDACLEVWFTLNKARNLGSVFLQPQLLKRKSYQICGNIEIDENSNVIEVIGAIDKKLNDYIFPPIISTSYQQLVESGESTNDIFNGPYLTSGWVSDKSILSKKDHLNSDEVTRLIKSVDGVESVKGIKFKQDEKSQTSLTKISCLSTELLVVDVFGSDFNLNSKPLSTRVEDGKLLGSLLQQSSITELKGQINSTQASLGHHDGQYRNINDYYSIQHTLPEVFGVGEASEHFKGTKEEKARRKQLIAYLTLFDQVLANEFSQLANLKHLFSFSNATTGTPSDETTFYRLRDQFQKKQLKYPVPYQCFSPTYFYQSLYETVTNIRPVLRNNKAYNFDFLLESEKEALEESWEEYQDSPYNTYIHGLMEIVEDLSENLVRRNALLNHLLARHGESPEVIDKIIERTIYSGNQAKDRVILKSAILRNLELLSYNKYKAYNYLSADKIQRKLEVKAENTFEGIQKRRQHDFIFDTERFEKETKLKPQDFINYSSIELLLNLLFGLDVIYRNYIVSYHDQDDKKLELKQILWLLQNRKGFVLIEKSLTYLFARFELFFESALDTDSIYSSEPIDYHEMLELQSLLAGYNEKPDGKNITIAGVGVTFKLHKIDKSSVEEKWFKTAGENGNKLALKTIWDNQLVRFENPNLTNEIICIFPSYVKEFGTVDFDARLNTFFEYKMPVSTQVEAYTATVNDFEKLIPHFQEWHNAMIHSDNNTPKEEKELKEVTRKLVSILTEIELSQTNKIIE